MGLVAFPMAISSMEHRYASGFGFIMGGRIFFIVWEVKKLEKEKNRRQESEAGRQEEKRRKDGILESWK
jgi:Skp family chaperone for outer membrane proteins